MRRAGRLAALALLATAAVAPPAAPVSLATTWLCFFDTSSAELSPRCQATIRDLAELWHRMRRGEVRGWPDEPPMRAYTMPVEVQGHADAAEATAGEAASVSKARAEAAAAFLRLNGVPMELIKVAPHGAERPIVPVAGAEPQNRPAEIIAR